MQASSSEINTLDARIDALEASQGSSSGLPTADYDSGWFYVKKNTDYSKTHNLGKQPRLAIVWQAYSSSGTNMSLIDSIFTQQHGYGGIGSWLQKITSTTYQISTGPASAGSGYGKTSHWGLTTGSDGSTYLRVLMWK